MSANLSLHSAPDAIEPVVGWRTWRIVRTDDGLRLTPVFHYYGDSSWPVNERFEANCVSLHHRLNDPHVAPDKACSCGIHAAKEVRGARSYVNTHNVSSEYVSWLAIGRVNLWGKVIEHEHGYRAQYAYPKQILLPDEIGNSDRKATPPDLEQVAAELRDNYGVPVLIVHPKKPSLLDRIKGTT